MFLNDEHSTEIANNTLLRVGHDGRLQTFYFDQNKPKIKSLGTTVACENHLYCVRVLGDLACTSGKQPRVRLWKLKTGLSYPSDYEPCTLLKTFTGHTGAITRVQFDREKMISASDDSRFFITATDDLQSQNVGLRIWRMHSHLCRTHKRRVDLAI